MKHYMWKQSFLWENSSCAPTACKTACIHNDTMSHISLFLPLTKHSVIAFSCTFKRKWVHFALKANTFCCSSSGVYRCNLENDTVSFPRGRLFDGRPAPDSNPGNITCLLLRRAILANSCELWSRLSLCGHIDFVSGVFTIAGMCVLRVVALVIQYGVSFKTTTMSSYSVFHLFILLHQEQNCNIADGIKNIIQFVHEHRELEQKKLNIKFLELFN